MTILKLPSGRTISPQSGIIGVDEDGRLFEGYDSPLQFEEEGVSYPRDAWELSPEDRAFIAEYMIARWRKFVSDGAIERG